MRKDVQISRELDIQKIYSFIFSLGETEFLTNI